MSAVQAIPFPSSLPPQAAAPTPAPIPAAGPSSPPSPRTRQEVAEQLEAGEGLPPSSPSFPLPSSPSSAAPLRHSAPSPSHDLTTSPPHASPSSSSSPHSPLATPHSPPLPPEILDLFIQHKFNYLALVERGIPFTQVLAFAADPRVAEHLQNLEDLTDRAVKIRANEAKLTVIETLQKICKTSEDPVEQRRAATVLYRATRSPVTPKAASRDSLVASAGSAPTPTQEPMPAPMFRPRLDHSAREAQSAFNYGFRHGDTPKPDTGFAGVAAYADDGCVINGQAVPTDTPEATFKAVKAILRPFKSLYSGHILPAVVHEDIAADIAHFTVNFNHLDHNRNVTRSVPLRLTMQKRADSRHPNCWLLTQMQTVDSPDG